MGSLSRRRFLGFSAAGSLAGLVGCKGGTPSIFGYQLGTDSLYDSNIHSVFVHAFYNRTLETGPFRNFEVYATQEVVHQIGQKTPFKVISDPGTADTELIGKIVSFQKNILNVTQQNSVREGEVVVVVDVVWRDLRDGKILSAPRKHRNPGNAPNTVTPGVSDPLPPQFDKDVLPPPDKYVTPQPEPVRIVAPGRYVEELGESIATALQRCQNELAVQIVSMMEKRW
jgi:Lipopolysaccharide-assembly